MFGNGSLLKQSSIVWLPLLGVLVAILIAEACLRMFPSMLPEEARLRVLWREQTSVKSYGDSYLGFLYPSNERREIQVGAVTFTVESDEHGFRNPSPWPERAEVVVLGDSMAYGWGVDADDTWFRLLDRELRNGRVISLGLPGTVPRQNLRYFERFGAALKPSVVLFSVFPGNDFKETDTFTRWLAAGSPGNYDVWRFFEGAAPVQEAPLLDRSYLVLFVRASLKNIQAGMNSKTVELRDGQRVQLVPEVYRSAIVRNDPSDAAFQSVLQSTRDARNVVEAAGAQFIVVLFPTKESVYLPFNGVPFPALTSPLAEILEKEGVSCIDLTEPFRILAADGRKLYFEIDGHPNELGNRVIADVVLTYLREHAGQVDRPE